LVVEIFNNRQARRPMATVNFSVPDEVKSAFDAAFAGRNKSAVIAELMRRAIDEQARQARRLQLFRVLTAGRAQRPKSTSAEIRRVRRSGRP
jgi:hypothetical protein